MDKIISKELLGEIEREEVIDIKIEKNIVKYNSDFDDVVIMREINIHELAHKCILYAWDNFYEITPRVMGAEVTCLKTGYIVHTVDAEEIEKPEKFDPRYVYKACQWVYESKKDN